MAKNLISIYDFERKEAWNVLSLARKLKAGKRNSKLLNGKTLGLIFEKPSTRTTVSFAVAMYELGGFPLVLYNQNLQRMRGEPIKDTAKTLSRYLDGMMIRAFRHSDVEELANWSEIPVINGLTDREHPCQILGDILTVMEHKKIKDLNGLKKLKIAFIGDGNNIANSWIGAASILGFKFSLARPAGYGPDQKILETAVGKSENSGAEINILEDPFKAVEGADVIYTDVWTSMGAEKEQDKRKVVFQPFQVNGGLLNKANNDCIVMHCLPANRGEEITAEVIDGPKSVIFDQAENRLHIQKAILVHLLK